MMWLTDILATLALSQVAFLGLYFLIHYRGFLARMISFFCVCLGAYLLATMSIGQGSALASYLLFRLATLAPFVLWIISVHLFVEGGRVSPVAWLAMGYFVLLRSVGQGLALEDPEILVGPVPFVFVQLIPQLILLFFSVHAVYLAYREYGTDLVEQRRTLRVAFVASMGVLIAIIVGMGLLSAFSAAVPTGTWLYSLYLFLAALAFNLFTMKLKDRALTLIPERSVNPRVEETEEAVEADPKAIEAIRRLMETEKMYRQPGLTIADLAAALSLQEYRLRKIINQGLRYRNFNQFLNSYRISDASERLRESDEPVSLIALEAGYSSLSVFNKAFRERYGMTPTEYRASATEAGETA